LKSDISDDTNAIAACRNTTRISVRYSVGNIISRKVFDQANRIDVNFLYLFQETIFLFRTFTIK